MMPGRYNYDDFHINKFEGGTKKIGEIGDTLCRHPEHSPPSMQVFEPGIYEHTCPGCGAKTIFNVTRPIL